MIRLGAQLSAPSGYDALIRMVAAFGLTTVQVFSRNPVGGQTRGLPLAGSLAGLLNGANVRPLFVHAPYFVNPASANPERHSRAVRVLQDEMRRVKRLSGDYLVMHPGHGQSGCRSDDIDTLAKTVTAMLSRPGRILIENAAGQGQEIGGDFGELQRLFSLLGGTRRVGLMLDTAHAMAFGWPLKTADDCLRLLDRIESTVGLHRVRGVHLNDSAYPVGARRDRHASLLTGQLGEEALAALMSEAHTRDWPLILETPGKDIAARMHDFQIIDRLTPHWSWNRGPHTNQVV